MSKDAVGFRVIRIDSILSDSILYNLLYNVSFILDIEFFTCCQKFYLFVNIYFEFEVKIH